MFEHTADRVLTWFRSGFGDGLDLKLRCTVPCETASDLVKPDLETLAVLTRAIANKRQVKVSYLSVASGASTKTLSPLALADTGLRWHLRAYDCERERFADFSLTRIVKAKNLNKPIPDAQQIEADAQWARIVRLEMVPHPGLEHPKAVEADFRMEKGMFSIDMRAPLVGYALRRWSVDCTTDHSLDCKEHHLWLRNHQTLYGVESATLAPGHSSNEKADE
ncbi:WYL domain-containing protein [Polynucleobacter sp. TUM22923]|uniref:helix-turn-helix transcriptional regulator n=1 Tax=Polynucleobacter sp. TUM22923 TaxID=3022126 RepID=UPI0025722897|nr:WYL domain-containing protein [Polynucleobacter sp. TUM22923]